MTSLRIAVVASAALLLASPVLAADECHLYRLTSIDMTIDSSGAVNVPMSVSGKDVHLLVDTGGVFSYWADGHAVDDFRLDDNGHIQDPVKLDGEDVQAGIDTGASRSVMALETAEDLFHVVPKSPELEDLGQHGFGHAYKYPVKT